ncbi:MAG: hypothetical protein ACOX2L_09225 [Anaerolineae bacterium]|nr:hypothetical protein [Chloroflexota bacterium]
MQTAVMFGAGSVGRGLMGQLLTASGYLVHFVDIDQALVRALNVRGSYTLTLADRSGLVEQTIEPVRATLSGDVPAVTAALETAALAATAVGARALVAIAPLLAAGLARRMECGVDSPLNVLMCENIPDAAALMWEQLEAHLNPAQLAFARAHLGLANMVIGRMVPEPTAEMRARDVTAILTEPYADTYADRGGFVGEVPEIDHLIAHAPLRPWIDRKLFIHNCVHCMMGYLGYWRGLGYGYQVLEDPLVRPWLAAALGESVAGLSAIHALDVGELLIHVAELWQRLGNRALGDPVRRLARDPLRKLAPADRLVGAARAAEAAGLQPDGLAWGIAAALRYDQEQDPAAVELQSRIAQQGVGEVLRTLCHIEACEPLGVRVLDRYQQLQG